MSPLGGLSRRGRLAAWLTRDLGAPRVHGKGQLLCYRGWHVVGDLERLGAIWGDLMACRPGR
jgi:hypothetical protein